MFAYACVTVLVLRSLASVHGSSNVQIVKLCYLAGNDAAALMVEVIVVCSLYFQLQYINTSVELWGRLSGKNIALARN